MNGVMFFIAGLAMLIFAAELVVRHGSQFALALGVKPIVVGLTIVAVGTSAPELAVAITASLEGSGDLAVGNIAGTNLANILFILGLSALLRPLSLHQRTVRLDLPMMVAAALVMTAFAWDGVLSRLDGALMLAIGAVYTVVLIWKSRSELRSVKADYKEMFGPDGARSQGTGETRKSVNAVFLLAGLILSVIGANLLVGGAVSIARNAGISEAVIGLTIVAVGTSAPELVTTIVGTLRNERDVAVGNLIGSSIYNILLILGISCLLAPAGLLVERHLLLFDIPLMTAVAILCIPVFITGKKVSRTEGGIFVTVYLVYLGYLVFLR